MSVFYSKIILILVLIATAFATSAWSRKNVYNSFRRTRINSKLNIPGRIRNHTEPKHAFHDLPTKKDFNVYMKSLQRIIDFCASNKNEIDINLLFGLFFVNVNLKTVIKHRHMNIPLWMLQPIRYLVKKNNELLKFFNYMVKKDKTMGNKQSKLIYSLFSNDTIWVERLDRYDAVFKTENGLSSFERLQAIYKSWQQYLQRIHDYERSIPSPRQSDRCLAALAESYVEVLNLKQRCILPKECYDVLEKGSNFGYSLTHRIIFMILARYGRGCSVFSPDKDRAMTTKYCTAAYDEAQYIVMHNYGNIDLLMEQITFCVINGHIEFLKRTWFLKIIRHQTSSGCFTQEEKVVKFRINKHSKPRPWVMEKKPDGHTIKGGLCNGHLTATVAAALSSAIRFIIATTKFSRYASII